MIYNGHHVALLDDIHSFPAFFYCTLSASDRCKCISVQSHYKSRIKILIASFHFVESKFGVGSECVPRIYIFNVEEYTRTSRVEGAKSFIHEIG